MITRHSSISTRKLSTALNILSYNQRVVAVSDYNDFYKMTKRHIITSLLGSTAQVHFIPQCCFCINIEWHPNSNVLSLITNRSNSEVIGTWWLTTSVSDFMRMRRPFHFKLQIIEQSSTWNSLHWQCDRWVYFTRLLWKCYMKFWFNNRTAALLVCRQLEKTSMHYISRNLLPLYQNKICIKSWWLI